MAVIGARIPDEADRGLRIQGLLGALADSVQCVLDRGGDSIGHPGHVEPGSAGDLARDKALPRKVEAQQRAKVRSPVHGDARRALVRRQVLRSCTGAEQHGQIEPTVANVAAPAASPRVRPVHDAAESTVAPQHVEVLVVTVDEDLLGGQRSPGSLARGGTQAAVLQPLQRRAILVPSVPPCQ
jgi:hypothetical protein